MNEENQVVLVFWIAFLVMGTVAVNGIGMGEQWAVNYCADDVTFSNPNWFSCGNEIDLMGENYYRLGLLPPFTIESYYSVYPGGIKTR